MKAHKSSKLFSASKASNLIAVNATEDFMDVLSGVTDPEEKRKKHRREICADV